MRLVTNSNNVNTLKLLVSSHVAKVKLETVFTAPAKDSKETLPVLEVDTGVRLWVPSAAAQFILESGGQEAVTGGDTESWLHWEATVLYPAVLALLSKVSDQSLIADIRSSLARVEEAAKNQKYLCGSTLGLADILIWCDVYPLLTDNKVKKEFSSLSSTLKWFENIFKEPSVTASLVKFGTGIDGCKNAAPTLFSVIPQSSSRSMAPALSSTSQGKEADPCVKSDTPLDASLVKAAKEKWNVKPTVTNTTSSEVLPQEGKRNIMITSALPYVNNVPHLGNIVGCVLSADVYARFARLRGYNVLYVCGTDEYGTQTETKAVEEGLTPRQICDKYNKLHAEIYQWFGISFDKFGRTTTDEQTKIAQVNLACDWSTNLILSSDCSGYILVPPSCWQHHRGQC